MKQILDKLFDHRTLDQAEARDVLLRISKGEFNHVQVAAFTTVYQMRPVSVEELDEKLETARKELEAERAKSLAMNAAQEEE